MESSRAGKEPEGAWIPSDGILGAQAKRGSDLALVDRVIWKGRQQKGVWEPCRFDAIDHQVPPAVASPTRSDGHDAKNPALADRGLPFLPCAHFARQVDFLAAQRLRVPAMAHGGPKHHNDYRQKPVSDSDCPACIHPASYNCDSIIPFRLAALAPIPAVTRWSSRVIIRSKLSPSSLRRHPPIHRKRHGSLRADSRHEQATHTGC